MASNYLQKGRATRSLVQWVNCYKNNIMKSYFDQIVLNTYAIVTRKETLTRTFKNIHQKSLLKNFTKWVNYTKLESIVTEELEGGVKKLEYLDYEQDLNNLVTFACKTGGYRENDVYEVINDGEDRVDMLQMRSIYVINSISKKSDEYLKPMVLQRWKQWVRMRKLFKHWLNY
jgi:hypothetical protein